MKFNEHLRKDNFYNHKKTYIKFCFVLDSEFHINLLIFQVLTPCPNTRIQIKCDITELRK